MGGEDDARSDNTRVDGVEHQPLYHPVCPSLANARSAIAFRKKTRHLLMEARLAPMEVESEENHSCHVDGSCKC